MKRTSGEVAATRVKDLFEGEIVDGAYQVCGPEDHVFRCYCPCGCGSMFALPVNKGDGAHPSWTWDKNLEKPTLSPSIRDLSGCKFHGHLISGVWTFTGDSGQ